MSEKRILQVIGAVKGRSIEQERHIRKDIRSHQKRRRKSKEDKPSWSHIRPEKSGESREPR